MSLFVATLILSCFSYALTAQECNCRTPKPGATTREGYTQTNVLEEKTPYKRLAGIVNLADHPVEDVLVEVFPYAKEPSKKRRRVAACITGTDGRYCFAHTPKGKYEVRVSKAGGFEITLVYVVVDPGSRRSSNGDLEITIEVGK